MATPSRELQLTKLTDGLLFGESPRWRNGRLYISDMTGCTIYAIDASGNKETVLEVENQPNGMAFKDDGTLIYSSIFDNKLYSYRQGETPQLYADVSSIMTGYCGDMVIDARGRVYLDDTGARVLHGESPCPGRLLLVDTDGSVRSVAEDVVFANGISIDSSGKKLYLSALYAYQLLSFDIAEDGGLSNRRVDWETKSLPIGEGKKWNRDCGIDGLCMDAEDGLWLSMLGHNAFVRKDSRSNITHRIEVDGDATACTLGGEDGRTLYLVVNKVPEGKSLFDAMVAKETRCSVYIVRVEVGHGKPWP